MKLANDTSMGLASYFITKDVNRIWHMLESLEAGMIGMNTGKTVLLLKRKTDTNINNPKQVTHPVQSHGLAPRNQVMGKEAGKMSLWRNIWAPRWEHHCWTYIKI